MNPRIARTTAALFAALSVGTAASANYIQLIDLPSLQDGMGGALRASVIDGDQAYVLMGNEGGASGQARVVRVDGIGGANNVSVLADSASFDAAVGSSIANLTGTIYDAGAFLYVADTTTDSIFTVSKATGAVTQLVDVAATAGGSSNPSFGEVDVDRDLAYYNTATDSTDKTTGLLNGFTTILDDVQLAAITGDDTPSGLGIDSQGVYYFGQSTSSVGEDITFFDPSDGTSGVFLTEADIVGGDDIGYSATAFTVLDDVLYMRDGGTADSFLAIDLATANVTTVLSEAQLLAGPAASDFAIDFSLFNGQLAWTQFSTGGGGIPGIYAVPEPATAALLGLGGLAMLRRRSA